MRAFRCAAECVVWPILYAIAHAVGVVIWFAITLTALVVVTSPLWGLVLLVIALAR